MGQSNDVAHGQYADEQLANLQKRIFLIEFLRLDLIIVYQGRTHSHQKIHRTIMVRFFLYLYVFYNIIFLY